ncbi:MAG: adenosine deaminase [Acidimicrobiales bacterium]
MAEFVTGLPKAELHMHVEGSLEPDLLFALAERNDIPLRYPNVDALRAAYAFDDLQSFLDLYYQGAAVLVTEQDFYDLMHSYLARAHGDGVRRTEIFFDPQTHTERGIGFEVFMAGFAAAIADSERETGLSADLIMCFLRHLGPEHAMQTFDQAGPYLDQIIGVGLDSTELGHPPEPYTPVFDRAAAAGLHRVAHAGEEGPPEYIWGALNALEVERIDHGVRSEEDSELMDRLVAEQIPLTVCPLSNLALKVVDNLSDHNLKRLLDRGVKVTINSDDPAYFGGHIAQNYIATASALGLSRRDLATLARNSFEAAFVEADAREVWLNELEHYVAVFDHQE